MSDSLHHFVPSTSAAVSAAHGPETPASSAHAGEAPAQTASQADFITNYVRYADVIEAPPEAHEAVAIQLLATALNPRVHIQHGAIKIPLDLWLLVLSGSGFGRNTLVDLARPILEAAGLSGLTINATWGSQQAFYQNIAQRSAGLFVWPELAAVLQRLRDNRFAGVKEWLTDRYDNVNVPEAIVYRQTGTRSDTPPITFQTAPRLNILATSSHDWFIGNLAPEDTTGGFVPRWMLRRIHGPGRLIPIPRATDQQLVAPLADHLRHAATLSGQADMSNVEDMYSRWYRDAHPRFDAQPNTALAMPCFNRLRTHVLKLAVVHQVSKSLSLQVTPEAMQRAINAAHESEEAIFSLLPTGMSREGSEVERMAARIEQAGAEGILRSEFTRAFQGARSAERDSRLHTLTDGGVVLRYWRQTGGRSAEVLVHMDHVPEHDRRFPEDRVWGT